MNKKNAHHSINARAIVSQTRYGESKKEKQKKEKEISIQLLTNERMISGQFQKDE